MWLPLEQGGGLNPVVRLGIEASFIDLEPLGLGRIKLVAGCTRTLRKVGEHGSGVVGPLRTTITSDR